MNLPARRTDVLARVLGDETVIVDPVSNQVHNLDADTTRVWQLCDGQASEETALAQLGISAQALTDALTALASAGLLTQTGLSRRGLFARGAIVVGGAGAATLLGPAVLANAASISAAKPGIATVHAPPAIRAASL